MLTRRSARRGAAESPDGATGSAVCSMSENRMLTAMLPGIAKRVPAAAMPTKFLRPEAMRTGGFGGERREGGKVLPAVTGARRDPPPCGERLSGLHLVGGSIRPRDELVDL